MPMTDGRITAAGAIIDVLVGVGPRRRRLLEKHGMHVPGPVAVRAVIDTEAGISGFAAHVFTSLELPPVGTVRILTPSNTPDSLYECELFDVTPYLVAGGAARPVLHSRVIASGGWHPAQEEGVEGLIGRDVLNCATFCYYGADRTFTLGFPDLDPAET